MADVLVQQSWRIDDEDLAVIVDALAEAGLDAAPTDDTRILKADWWVLTLEWAAGHADKLVEPALTLLAAKLWRHVRSKKPPQDPPRFIDLLGPDGDVIKRVEVDGDD
jgi:hypothetical protein